MTQGKERPYKLKTRPGHVATIKSPTEREKRGLMKILEAHRDDDLDTTNLEVACRNHVKSIAPPIEHRGVLIATGEDVVEYAPEEVLAELATEVQMETSLQPGEGKLSGGPSGSSLLGSSTGEPGTAASAASSESAKLEGAA